MRLPKNIELKQQNRWVIEFKNNKEIKEWYLISAERPKFKSYFINFLGYKTYDIDLVFRESVDIKLSKILLDLFKYNTKIDFDIIMLDGYGEPLEKWVIEKSVITQIDFGSVNYFNDDATEITATFRPKRIKIE